MIYENGNDVSRELHNMSMTQRLIGDQKQDPLLGRDYPALCIVHYFLGGYALTNLFSGFAGGLLRLARSLCTQMLLY